MQARVVRLDFGRPVFQQFAIPAEQVLVIISLGQNVVGVLFAQGEEQGVGVPSDDFVFLGQREIDAVVFPVVSVEIFAVQGFFAVEVVAGYAENNEAGMLVFLVQPLESLELPGVPAFRCRVYDQDGLSCPSFE